MLSSPERRFWWSKQDRLRDPPPLFRVFVRRWRPVARKPPAITQVDAAKSRKARTSWNHWLWIK